MWKLNVSLLDDEDYLKDLEQNITKVERSFWDWIKYNIRMDAIWFSKEKAKQRNENEKLLQNEKATTYKACTRICTKMIQVRISTELVLRR